MRWEKTAGRGPNIRDAFSACGGCREYRAAILATIAG